MKFKITSIRDNGSLRTDIYDNIANTVIDSDGQVIDFRKDPHCDNMIRRAADEADKSAFHPKHADLRKLKIQLGFKCNFSCAYCTQRAYEKQIPIVIDSPSLVDSFIARLSRCVKSTKEILFMGGEPFVYLKLLKKLCPELRRLYPDARFHTITNGSLLTRDLADWCIDVGMNLTVSHDGPRFGEYRTGENILDRPEIIEGIRHFHDRAKAEGRDMLICFNVVVTPENRKLSDLPDYFRQKIGRDLPIQFESIVKLNEKTEAGVSPFDEKSSNELLNEMFTAGIDMSEDNRLSYFRNFAQRVSRRIAAGKSLCGIRFYCDNSRADTMSVDLRGHLLACQAYPYTLTGYGEMEEFASAVSSYPKTWDQRPNCGRCPFLVSCLGGCPLQTPKAHEISCGNLRIWHMGLFLIAWHLIFTAVITDITPLED